MALPGHSPAFNNPSSPPRTYPGYSDAQAPSSMYGSQSRPMLPPSPQHYPPPRFSQPPLPPPSTGPTYGPAPPAQTRPGSSMSISSMLGAEPDKPSHDTYHGHGQHSRTPSRQASGSGQSMSLGAVMSPPQHPARPNGGDYSYKPRATTPDRLLADPVGARPHRSSSGTMMHRPGPFYEPPPRSMPPQAFSDAKYTPPLGPAALPMEDLDGRARTAAGVGAVLQPRPESQPQPTVITSAFTPTAHPPTRAESIPPSFAQADRSLPPSGSVHDPAHSNGGSVTTYDTRPPPSLPSLSRLGHMPQVGPGVLDRPLPQSSSPELRRPGMHGLEHRGLAGILNQPPDPIYGAPNMMRQDSIQSQSDRSLLGDRMRNRPYSPFAGSVTSQTAGPQDDQARKGSIDELSQHRAILGLANESKRGRYSPVPQAVQGAQAQTPTPDAGIKNEHGRVFAGLGTGLGAGPAAPSPTPQSQPQPLPASPFKRDEGGARLSEENLMKMSRSVSGIHKRSRKNLDADSRAESEGAEPKRANAGRGKRSKYQTSYKLDADDGAPAPKRNALYGASSSIIRTATPTSHLPLSASDAPPFFKPNRIYRVDSVLAGAQDKTRRHLGSFKYNPDVAAVDVERVGTQKFDVSIRPNLLPSFTDPGQVNCTYTVRVPRMWIQRRERGIICAERFLWGTGIYTDDSDPVAAAMHSGFIPTVYPPGIDEALLDKVIAEQNPIIEGGAFPTRPTAVDENKDLHITLLVLPPLESYAESARFGIKSRSWPDTEPTPLSTGTGSNAASTKAPHDGASFMVLKIEFVDDGAEVKRVGRTGKDKRERLRLELLERQRGFELEKERLARAAAKAKAREQNGVKQNLGKSAAHKNAGVTRSAASRKLPRDATQQSAATEEEMMKLDVGQSPGDWIRQLAVAAA